MAPVNLPFEYQGKEYFASVTHVSGNPVLFMIELKDEELIKHRRPFFQFYQDTDTNRLTFSDLDPDNLLLYEAVGAAIFKHKTLFYP
jgi:hypothetical protein